MIRRALLIAAIAAVAVVPVSGHAAGPDCNDKAQNFATFLQPKDGQLAVSSQAGTITFSGPTPTTGTLISTTGNIQVQIDQSCIQNLTLKVTKDGNPTPIHTNSWSLDCAPGTHSEIDDTVNIGMDGGNYTFELSGTSCTGLPLRSSKGGLVGDPPLPAVAR